MSEIERFTPGNFGHMLWDKNGGWVRYQDHLVEVERLTVERDKARAGDDVALSALTSALRERDAAQAEVERLIRERVAAQAETKRLVDRLAWAEARVDEDAETGRIAAERDAAQAEVERLRAEVERLQANGQGMLDTSRPSDEDIWREAFMMAMQRGGVFNRMSVADLALAEYRNRWPR